MADGCTLFSQSEQEDFIVQEMLDQFTRKLIHLLDHFDNNDLDSIKGYECQDFSFKVPDSAYHNESRNHDAREYGPQYIPSKDELLQHKFKNINVETNSHKKRQINLQLTNTIVSNTTKAVTFDLPPELETLHEKIPYQKEFQSQSLDDNDLEKDILSPDNPLNLGLGPSERVNDQINHEDKTDSRYAALYKIAHSNSMSDSFDFE